MPRRRSREAVLPGRFLLSVLVTPVYPVPGPLRFSRRARFPRAPFFPVSKRSPNLNTRTFVFALFHPRQTEPRLAPPRGRRSRAWVDPGGARGEGHREPCRAAPGDHGPRGPAHPHAAHVRPRSPGQGHHGVDNRPSVRVPPGSRYVLFLGCLAYFGRGGGGGVKFLLWGSWAFAPAWNSLRPAVVLHRELTF